MIPGYRVAIGAVVGRKRKLDRTSTANAMYIGSAASGSATSDQVWHIQKLVFSEATLDNLVEVLDANGSLEEDEAWDARTSLTYN